LQSRIPAAQLVSANVQQARVRHRVLADELEGTASEGCEKGVSRGTTGGTRVALDKLKNRRQLTKEAQVEFNRFIRERDRAQPCICCGSFTADSDLITGSRWDAGHYRSTGAAPHLRFNEDNCHRQRVVCNRNGSGRAVEYRRGLINRIGIARVEALENDNSIRKFSALELREVRDLYRRRRKEMEKAV
jgi:hypothetical protein